MLWPVVVLFGGYSKARVRKNGYIKEGGREGGRENTSHHFLRWVLLLGAPAM